MKEKEEATTLIDILLKQGECKRGSDKSINRIDCMWERNGIDTQKKKKIQTHNNA